MSLRSFDDLTAAVGQHLGYGDWLPIEQERIDLFAEATADDQWIHIDPARAAEGPFGSTIAHGYLTLSLLPHLVRGVLDYAGWATKINYGCDKVRFPQPVRVGSSLRAGVELQQVREVKAGIQVTNLVTVEIEYDGQLHRKPALIAETLTLLVD